MRVLYLLILLFLAGIVVTFAVQNRDLVTLRFLGWSITSQASLLIVVGYMLGMVSGWTVIGVGRRAFRQVVTQPSRG